MQPKTRAELKQQGYVIGKEAASILGIHHDRKTLSRYVVRFHIKAQLPLSKDGTLSNVWMYHKEDCEKARKKIDAEKEAKAIANCPTCYFYRQLSGFGYACHYAIETELPKVYHGAECYQKEGTHYLHKN